MLINTLFIGGPLDGQRRSIPRDQPVIEFPLLPEPGEATSDPVDNGPIPYQITRYARVRVFFGDLIITFYRHGKINEREAIMALLDGYRIAPKAKT